MKHFSKNLFVSTFLGIFLIAVLFAHASPKSKIVEKLFESLGRSSDEVAEGLWKGSKYADELEEIARRYGGSLSSADLAEKLGRAGDTEFVKKLDSLSSAERKVLGEIADITNDFIKTDPKRAVKIFNEIGVDGVHRSRTMGKDSELFFHGIENEGRDFFMVLEKGGPDAVRFYNDVLLPKKRLPGFEAELAKFIKNSEHYINAAGKPTKLGKELLKKLERRWYHHPKLQEIKKAAVIAITSLAGTLAAGIAGFLNSIPLLAGLAAHSVMIAWGLLVFGLMLLLKVFKYVYRFVKPKANDGKIFYVNSADGTVVKMHEKRVKRSRCSKPTAKDRQVQEPDITVSPVNNWPVVAISEKGIIDIGIIGARAAGKSTFIVMLIDIFQRIVAQGISLQPDACSSQTQTAMNKYRNEIENFGRVRSTLEHVELLFDFRKGQSDSYRFRMTDYPGEDLKPKEEVSKEIGNYGQWLGSKDGLLLLVDPLRTDEEECRATIGTDHVQPIVMQEEIIPFILQALLVENNCYPKPVACILTKVDQLHEKDKNMHPDDLVKKYFPQIYSALKTFAPHLKCFAISSTGGVLPDLAPGHSPVREQFKPYGLDEPLYWLLKEMPERCFDIIKTNNKKWSWNSKRQTLQGFISRFQSSEVVNEAEVLFEKLKRKHWLRITSLAVVFLFAIVMVSIAGHAGLKKQKIARINGQIEDAQRMADFQYYERALSTIIALESELSDPVQLEDVRNKTSQWADLLLAEHINKASQYINSVTQDYQKIFPLLEDFNEALNQWGFLVQEQSYQEQANNILYVARDEKNWQEEIVPFINDVNYTMFDKYIKLTHYLDTNQANRHKIEAENRRSQIKQELKDNFFEHVMPTYKRVLSAKKYDEARQILDQVRRIGLEIELSSEQQVELEQYAEKLDEQERENHHKTILTDIERLKSKEKWKDAIQLMKIEIQNSDSKLSAILEQEKNELINGYKAYTLSMVSKQRNEKKIDDAITNCNEYLTTVFQDEEVRELLSELEQQRDRATYELLKSDLSDDFSGNIKTINDYIANESAKHPTSAFIAEAKNLKNMQLEKWAELKYRKIYANWHYEKWFEKLDDIARRMNEFTRGPFTEELGASCPHINDVEKIRDWYNELQNMRKYTIKYITIDNLKGEIGVDSKPDLKILITFSGGNIVEVEESNVGKLSPQLRRKKSKL